MARDHGFGGGGEQGETEFHVGGGLATSRWAGLRAFITFYK